MITIERTNTLSQEFSERYRQEPRHRQNRDREAFCDAVKAGVATGLDFRVAQIGRTVRETEVGGRRAGALWTLIGDIRRETEAPS